jgi:hypothetical protein
MMTDGCCRVGVHLQAVRQSCCVLYDTVSAIVDSSQFSSDENGDTAECLTEANLNALFCLDT